MQQLTVTPELRELITALNNQMKAIPEKPLLEIWDKWVKSLNLPPRTKSDHYEMVRRMITKSQPMAHDIDWLLDAGIAASTFNKRKGYLRTCCYWAITKGLMAGPNPWDEVRSRKEEPKVVEPFKIHEITSILEEFDRSHPAYAPFCRFMFLTGVRTGEASALQWKHVDFDKSQITIAESLAVDRTGNGYQKIRKSTKTGGFRVLGMSEGIKRFLESIKPEKSKPDALVFVSPKGFPVDANNFRARWREVLAKLEIPYQKPYTTRHTLLSHAIDKGYTIFEAAALAGHKDGRMVLKHYGHLMQAKPLPDIL